MTDVAPTLTLTKHHGLGNDFLVALEHDNRGLRPSADLARRWCDRHRGVGADGLIFAMDPTVPGADVEMILFNADGSVAEISGNGIRCLGQAVLRARGAHGGDVTIDSGAGRRLLRATATDDPNRLQVSVDMGAVGEGPPLGPRSAAFDAVGVATADIGNPHLVIRLDSLSGIDPAEHGPLLEADYPLGMNVHFLAQAGPDAIELLHWERGAGVTEACGSGATVSAHLAHRWGLVGSRVNVAMPGGDVIVEVGDPMVLIGEAVYIATVEVPHAS